MLSIETVQKVLELPNHPHVKNVQIAEGMSICPTNVTIYTNDDADIKKVLGVVKEIFPDFDLEKVDEKYFTYSSGESVIWTTYQYERRGKLDLRINHYASIKKDLAQDQETNKNTQPDFTTEGVIAQ